MLQEFGGFRKNALYFLDMELCQLDKVYLHFLTHYNKCLAQRNALLKGTDLSKDAQAMLDVWDAQLIQHGKKIIQLRETFVGCTRQFESVLSLHSLASLFPIKEAEGLKRFAGFVRNL